MKFLDPEDEKANPRRVSSTKIKASVYAGNRRNFHHRAILRELHAVDEIPPVRKPSFQLMWKIYGFTTKDSARRHRNIWKNRRLHNIRQARKFKQKMLNILAEAA